MKRHKKLIALYIFALITTAIVIAIQLLLGDLSSGAITTGGTSIKKPAAAEQNTLETEHGTYASFNYPSYFIMATSDPAVVPVLTNYSFIKSQVGSWQLAIQISQLETGNINNNSSYHYRKVFSEQYDFSSRIVAGVSIPIATDRTISGYNKVAYVTKGTKVASVSLMGGNDQDTAKIDAALTTILSSWQWL